MPLDDRVGQQVVFEPRTKNYGPKMKLVKR